MLDQISFRNYKIFQDWQTLELRPMTILIGKNSSGKSVLTKLPTWIEESLSGKFEEPLLMKNNGVEIGGEFRDLVYGRLNPFHFWLKLVSGNESLSVQIVSGAESRDYPLIREWHLQNEHGEFSEGMKSKFKGFQLDSLNPQTYFSKLSLSTDYIGPFRSVPIRIFDRPDVRQIKKLGPTGENVYPLLNLDSLDSNRKLTSQIDQWYKANFDGWGIRVNRDRSPYYEIEMTWNDRLNINIVDVGQGMSQVLPLVARAFMPVDEEMLIILEQPELHIHPGAHGNLAQLFAESTKDKKRRYLIETHSKTFVMRLRRMVAEKKIRASDLLIYHVDFDDENGSGQLNKIEVDEFGDVSEWPEHVFSDALDEAIALRTAQINLEKNAN
jgi:hypothetical protein